MSWRSAFTSDSGPVNAAAPRTYALASDALGSPLACAGVAGARPAESSDRYKEGQSLNRVRGVGAVHGSAVRCKADARHYSAFVELHIEQGPLLEKSKLKLAW